MHYQINHTSLLTAVGGGRLPELVARGTDGDGPFIVETWIEGRSLQRIAANRPTPVALSKLIRAAAEALAELHSAAVAEGPLELVHGDIAPDHVVLGPDEQVRFIDLGQGRWQGMNPEWGGDDRGTLPFVAPELLRGEAMPDQAADVFALAASLAFLALGAEPVRAQLPTARLVEVAEQGLDLEAIAACAALEPEPRQALLTALAFDRDRRIDTAAGLCAAVGP